MNIANCASVTFWRRKGVLGGLECSDEASAGMAIVRLSSGGLSQERTYLLPEQRDAYNALILGLEFGVAAGRLAKANEVRAVLGSAPVSRVS